MTPRLTQEFFLYEQPWSDAGIIIRTDQEVPDNKLEGFSLAVCKSVEWPPKRHIYRLTGETREKQIWETIKNLRKTGAVGWDDKPWDLEVQIRKDPSEFKRTDEFEGIRFWVVYLAQSC